MERDSRKYFGGMLLPYSQVQKCLLEVLETVALVSELIITSTALVSLVPVLRLGLVSCEEIASGEKVMGWRIGEGGGWIRASRSSFLSGLV